MAAIRLKPGRERSLLRRHPWVFSGAIQSTEGDPVPGGTVDVYSSEGQFLARAAYSPDSQIRLRVWTFEDDPVDHDFFRRKIAAAIHARDTYLHENESDSCRLINAESDDLPGIIVDRYNHTLVLQCLTAGAEFWREAITDLLIELTGLSDIYERSDVDVRQLEGLPQHHGPLRGKPNEIITLQENGLKFKVNLALGHKTGFYLDQRRNRQRLRSFASGRQVLDCFSYTGGFSVNALVGGANSVLAVDSSEDALSLAQENASLNSFSETELQILCGDVFQVLRKFRDEARSFDLIVLDPPKFAPTVSQLEKATRGYKDINLLAFKLLRPGGILFTFSCSGGVDAGLFQKIVASAALDAGVQAQILEHLSQAPDHPIGLNFPEGAYLKGLICSRQ